VGVVVAAGAAAGVSWAETRAPEKLERSRAAVAKRVLETDGMVDELA
jgi:hypothetical protein